MTTTTLGNPCQVLGTAPHRVVRGNLGRDKKALAHDIIDYLARLEVTQGRLTGTHLHGVQAWQQRFVLGAFA